MTRCSVLPMRTENDAAEVCSLEPRILERQEIIVERTECAARTMFHPLIKLVDHLMSEIGSAGIAGDDRPTLFVCELLKATTSHIHSRPCLQQGNF